MFKSWRFQLREAEEAFRAERLDEAVRLLTVGDLQQCLPGKQLAALVAERIAQRALQRFQREGRPGWCDLQIARSLGAQGSRVSAVEGQIVHQIVSDAKRRLARGEPVEAIRELEALDRHCPENGEVRTLLEVARRLESARNLRVRGQFEEAELQLERVAALLPDLTEVAALRELYQRQAREVREVSEQLHRAMSDSDWTQTLALAGRLLEISPKSALAADARRRAWMAVGSPRDGRKHELGDNGAPHRTMEGQPSVASPDALPERFLLWVDGVGGFLVCLNDRVVVGQAVPGNRVDVPILADLSRHHVHIRREDRYLLEPLGDVWLEGRAVHRTAVLSDGDEIRLGNGVQLRFRQPHPLSASARLELTSNHHTQPSVDGILLMSDSCVLGPKWQNHVVCRDWSGDVVLYRRDGALYCRAMEGIEVDGRFCEGQQRLDWDSHVAGSDFSLSLERIG